MNTKLTGIYVPSLNIAYLLDCSQFPQELSNVSIYKATEIRDRSQEFEDHTEYYFEATSDSFTRCIIDIPVILFYAETEDNEK